MAGRSGTRQGLINKELASCRASQPATGSLPLLYTTEPYSGRHKLALLTHPHLSFPLRNTFTFYELWGGALRKQIFGGQ